MSSSLSSNRYKDKVILVTGSGGGIGRAIALQFASEGGLLVLNGRTESKLQETVKLIQQKYNGKAVYLAGDISSEEVNKNLVELALTTYGKLDIAINNAAVYILKKLVEYNSSEIASMINSNIYSLIYGTKYQLTAIAKTSTPNNQGVIINIGSVAAVRPFATGNVYAATKGFLDTFTKSMASEGVEYNVRVNAINPGVTISDGTEGAFGISGIEQLTKTVSLTDKPATGQEIATFLLDVVSNRYINGSLLYIDGGAGAK